MIERWQIPDAVLRAVASAVLEDFGPSPPPEALWVEIFGAPRSLTSLAFVERVGGHLRRELQLEGGETIRRELDAASFHMQRRSDFESALVHGLTSGSGDPDWGGTSGGGA
jgi:hypothetical protein